MSSDEEESYDNLNEEEMIKEELAEMELGKIVEAQKKLMYKEKFKLNTSENVDKKKLKELYDKLNKEKSKDQPKEFSALVKPKPQIKIQEEKKYFRDPRFDNLSGEYKSTAFKKNYTFVNDLAEDYINKLEKIKKEKGKKLNDAQYELIKKQTNFVKGWKKNQELTQTKDEIKTELNRENKTRMKTGKNPIYLKKKVVNKLVHTEKMNQREGNKEDMNKFLKRKKHKEIVRTKKEEKSKQINNL